MVLQRLATEEQLRVLDRKEALQVTLNLLIVPGEDRADGQVREVALRGLALDLLYQSCLPPVLVNDHQTLRTAFLA